MLTIDVAKGSKEAFWLFKNGVKRFLVYGDSGGWRVERPGSELGEKHETLFAALHAAIQKDRLEESAKRLAGRPSKL